MLSHCWTSKAASPAQAVRVVAAQPFASSPFCCCSTQQPLYYKNSVLARDRACASDELASAQAERAAATSAAASAPASRRQRPSRSGDTRPAAVGPLGIGTPPAALRNLHGFLRT